MQSRKLTALGVALSMCFLQIPVVFAGQTTILTDAELDAVHAGGLNFTFEKFFGSLNDATSQTAKNVNIPLSNNPVIVTPNGNITVQLPIAPAATTSPTVPTAPMLPGALPQSTETLTHAPSLNDSANVAAPVVTDILSSGNPTSLNNNPVVSTPDTTPLNNPQISVSNPTPLNDSPLASASSGSLPPEQSNNNSVSNLASLPQSNLSNIWAGDSAAFSSATAALNVSPSVPATPVVPIAPAVPTFVMDVLSGKDGSLGMNLGFKPNAESSLIPLSSPGNINSLNVSDTAQQYLNSLVNVNASGSTVPVQVNLIVLMNSTVENLNVSNSLQLNNYTTLQLK